MKFIDQEYLDYCHPSVKILRARWSYYTEEVNLAELHNQEDLTFRWLESRRDYPYYKPPPPDGEYFILRRCIAEFCRSNPGFEL